MAGAMADGFVVEPNRSMTFPSLLTKNFVKFHSVLGKASKVSMGLAEGLPSTY